MPFSGRVPDGGKKVHRAMSYEDYIEEFWMRSEAIGLDSSQIALGLAILRYWRKDGFPSRCFIKNEELCNLLGMEIRKLRAARKRLIDNNLIVFEEGNGRKQPVYVFGVAGVVPGVMEDMEREPEPPPPPRVVPPPVQKVKRVVKVSQEPTIFKEKDMEQPKRKAKEYVAPQFSEVMRICMGKGMTEQEAREFFYYYDAQGWVTSSGQRIKNVDSMVNRWLTIQKKRDESDRRLIQSGRPSVADNIRESQEYLIREMRQSVFSQTDGYSGEVPEGLPDY